MEEKFDINSTDDELLETFDMWLKESLIYHDHMLIFQKTCEQYYLGNQTSQDLVPSHNSSVVENRIFEGVETLVPIVTASAHEFTVMPGSEDEKSLKRAKDLQKVLIKKYQNMEMQRKLEEATRHILLYRFSVLKYTWDEYLDDIDVHVIDPRLILIPKLRVDPHRLPYVMEIQEYTRAEMEEYFPKADLDSLVMVDSTDLSSYSYPAAGAAGNQPGNRKVYKVYEVWTDEMAVWFCSKQLLEKKSNPYWDFEGEIKKQYEYNPEGKKRIKKNVIFRNHLSRPEKPYIFGTTFNVTDGPVAATSLVEIVMPIQDSINIRKRKIIDNLRTMGNGQVYIDDDAISQEDRDNITDEPGLVLMGPYLASQNKIRREAGLPLPASHFNDLQHSESVFENIMGVHSTTRGQANTKTLGQALVSRQQDYTRIDLLTRVLNRMIYRLANGLVQLMKLYYTDTHTIKILGEEGTIEFISLNRNDIQDYIEIDVKDGQTLPMDAVSLRNEAIQLWQLGAISPITLFERLEFPDPEKTEQDLLRWKQGQLSMETQANIVQAQAGAAAKAAAAPQGNDQGRGIESPLNVLQRANVNLGGVAPVAPGTPKL